MILDPHSLLSRADYVMLGDSALVVTMRYSYTPEGTCLDLDLFLPA